MPCARFLKGTAGQNATFKVTQDNGESLWALLSDVVRDADSVSPTFYTGEDLRNGIAFGMVSGHSYHFTVVKAPSSGSITVRDHVPANSPKSCSGEGRFLGPWVIRVA